MNKILFSLISCTCLALAGCSSISGRPYATPILKDISPSQTAFLVPLIGDTTQQAKFDSEGNLNKLKVASKQIEIPQRWLQTGRMQNTGEWIPSAQLIVLERKPVSREWTKDQGTGTSNNNQSFQAETRDSNTFTAEMTCNAQIDEDQAVKFLYRFNTKSLDEVLDQDVRHMIASRFSEECAKYNADQFLVHKQDIMTSVRSAVIPFFKDRGINITVLGMIGDIKWANEKIQAALDDKFTAEQEKIAAVQRQAQAVAEAQSRAKVAQFMATAEGQKQQAFELQKLSLEVEKTKWSKWSGNFPTVMGGNPNMLMPMDSILGSKKN